MIAKTSFRLQRIERILEGSKFRNGACNSGKRTEKKREILNAHFIVLCAPHSIVKSVTT